MTTQESDSPAKTGSDNQTTSAQLASLETDLRSPSPQVRLEAIRKVQELADRALCLLPVIAAAIGDSDEEVAHLAYRTFDQLCPEVSEKHAALWHSLSDDDMEHRLPAARELVRLLPSIKTSFASASGCGVMEDPVNTLPISSWLPPYLAGSSIGVLDFISRHRLQDSLQVATGLVEKHFSTKPTIDLEADPDGEGEWLALRFDTHGGIEHVLEVYDRCKAEWVSRDRGEGLSRIRFVHNII
jgi:hypothetical protein